VRKKKEEERERIQREKVVSCAVQAQMWLQTFGSLIVIMHGTCSAVQEEAEKKLEEERRKKEEDMFLEWKDAITVESEVCPLDRRTTICLDACSRMQTPFRPSCALYQ